MRYWMFSCKEISVLIAQSMDRRLSLWERTGVRFHLLMCHLCRRFQRQLFIIRDLLAERRRGSRGERPALSQKARERIRQRLRGEVKKESGRPGPKE